MPKFVDNLCRVTDDVEVDDLAPAWPIHDVHDMGEERLLLVARHDEQTATTRSGSPPRSRKVQT